MPFGSREKGAKGELEVISLLEPWWRQLEPTAVFARTPGSGGFGTREVREGFQLSGDLMTSKAPLWPFCVEVKRREGFSPASLVAGKKSPVWTWWTQTLRSSEEMKREPMMWFRKNNASWSVLLRRAYFVGNPRLADVVAGAWGHGSVPRTRFGIDEPVLLEARAIVSTSPDRFALV